MSTPIFFVAADESHRLLGTGSDIARFVYQPMFGGTQAGFRGEREWD